MRHLIFILPLLALIFNAQASMVRVDKDLIIHYESAGHGKQVILLVPGWTMTTEVFTRQLAHYKNSRDYRLIVIDPRSQGLSTHTIEGNFYEQHGRDLANFIKALNLKNVVLGGWSYGGFDVLSYVHQYGAANLRGFIMMDSVPRCLGHEDAAHPNEWYWFEEDGSDGAREEFTQGTLLNRSKLNDAFARSMVDNPTHDYMKWILRNADETGSGVAALLNESGLYQNYESDLKSLQGKVPLLYYMSEKSTRVENWSRVNTPSATIVKYGKHLSFWEHPEVFNRTLDNFLTGMR
ncbi:alpha/beta fold hydrolase [Pantoea ananatis]|uniref:alpha/beta fold hydrolase n=1 Tax=Pantoea ananas TaxID=553 RepID=UPI00119EF231|nr:alpha/beta hydrolase [Pantoea ananatis]